MATVTHRYDPDYAVPPGWVLQEHLDAQGMSAAECARRCGRSPKLISEILTGKAPIEPKTALQFEKVLGLPAAIWMGIDSDYRLRQTRAAEAQQTSLESEWAAAFPVKDLVQRGTLSRPAVDADEVSALLSFFGVATVEAWQVKYGRANVAYRHSPSFKSDPFALAAWLRLAEIEAVDQTCADFRPPVFRASLKAIRKLTAAGTSQVLEEARQLCNAAGVALTLVKPFPKTRLSGAAWWLSAGRPVIALSARHKTDDHLWFSLLHEAAHILLHGKRTIFVDEIGSGENKVEAEANAWAEGLLIPRADWRRFVARGTYGRPDICHFAEEQGIAPGIVVGRLQHEKLLPWTHLNDLKVQLRWK